MRQEKNGMRLCLVAKTSNKIVGRTSNKNQAHTQSNKNIFLMCRTETALYSAWDNKELPFKKWSGRWGVS